MIHILNVEPRGYCDEARGILQSLGQLCQKEMTRSELIRCIADYDILIVRLAHRIDDEVLSATKRLLAVITATTGTDHIAVNRAEQLGVKVLSLKGQTEFLRSIPATAEHTWGMLLALLRHIPWAFESVKQGQWARDHFRGHDLASRRLGILGLGRIGERVAQYGRSFGMKVAAYDPFRRQWPADVHRCVELTQLLQESDVLTIHVWLDDSTTHLIGRAELAAMPMGSVLINTARAAVVDQDALVEALASGQLSGAAVDVLEGEQDPADCRRQLLIDYCRSHENLLITPHLGGATFESMASTEVYMAQMLAEFLRERRDVAEGQNAIVRESQ